MSRRHTDRQAKGRAHGHTKQASSKGIPDGANETEQKLKAGAQRETEGRKGKSKKIVADDEDDDSVLNDYVPMDRDSPNKTSPALRRWDADVWEGRSI